MNDSDFDERYNFLCSEIGELASATKTTKGPNKPNFEPNVKHYIFGFFQYLVVSRPCWFCIEKGCGGNCECPLKAVHVGLEVVWKRGMRLIMSADG